MKNGFKSECRPQGLSLINSALVVIVTVIFLFGWAASGVPGATLFVTKVADTNDGVCNTDCSLREAIAVAVAGDTVAFSGLFSTPQTILLAGTHGQFLITKNLIIDGPGARLLTITGNNAVRVISIGGAPGTTVSIRDLAISSGNAGAGFGGGIIVSQSVILNLDEVLVANSTAAKGGGIYNIGTINLRHSLVRNNSSVEGGGIYNAAFGVMQILNSTITNNSGGANSAGGGILNIQQVTLLNSTISHNTSSFGGGIRNIGNQMSIRNTIVASNTAANSGPDVNGDFNSLGNNLIGINTSATIGFPAGNPNANNDLVGTAAAPIDPKLDALQDNGGPTDTRGLLIRSPAIDKANDCAINGSCAGVSFILIYDQRRASFFRRGGDTVDIGAFEVQHTTVTSLNDSGAGSLRQVIADALPNSIVNLPSEGTINLVSGLTVFKSLVLRGTSARAFTIQRSLGAGTPNFRIFDIGGTGTVVDMGGLTIANGNSTNNGGGIHVGAGSTVYMTDTVLRNNSANLGGAIMNFGTLQILRSLIHNNTGITGGGAIRNNLTLTITNTTVTNNMTPANGGAISDVSQMNLVNCTISHNTAAAGGGIYKSQGATTNVRNSIIAANMLSGADGRVDISGSFASQGNNLIGNNQGSTGFTDGINGDKVGSPAVPIDPMLGPLADNEGLTDTRAPIYPSLTINAGNNCVTTATCGAVNNPSVALTTDQRGTGFARVSGSTIDMGAFENTHVSVTNTVETTLRNAISDAAPGSIINLAPSGAGCTGGVCTISLTSSEVLINKTLTILGPGARNLIIERSSAPGTPNFRIFNISGAVNVEIFGTSIANGNTAEDGGGIFAANGAKLSLSQVWVRNNTGSSGGGIRNAGTLIIERSLVSNNSGTLQGAGIYSNGTATIVNSTITGNVSAGNGGGILDVGQLDLVNVSISHNRGNVGGGVLKASGGPLNLRNTIIAANISGNGDSRVDVNGVFTSHGNNLIGINNGASPSFPVGKPNANGDRVGTPAAPINPLLGPLANNGGPTDTLAPIYGSLAINNGNDCVTNHTCPDNNPQYVLTTDQRGTAFVRVSGSAIDIGAFENAHLSVTSTAESTLRTMISSASGGTILTLAPTGAGCTGGVCTINLTTGDLLISKSLNIVGPGARNLIVQRADGSPRFRIFSFSGNIGGSLSGLTIRNGSTAASGGGLENSAGSLLWITGTSIKDNLTNFYGAGIWNDSVLVVSDSTINNNRGEAINLLSRGGGIFNSGTLSIANSSISGNITNVGAGVDNGSPNASARINNTTITNNQASGPYGGIWSNGAIELRNTVSAQNTGTNSPNVQGTFISRGNNLIGDNTGATVSFPVGSPNANGDRVGTSAAPIDPLLGPLANNGGQTDTHKLLSQSPALDNGNSCVTTLSCPNNNPPSELMNDQRGNGFPRQVLANVDIGAFEVAAAPDLRTTKTGTPGTVAPGAIVTFVVTVTNIGSATATNVQMFDGYPGGFTIVPGSVVLQGFTSCPANSTTITCSAASLAAGAVASIQYQMMVSSTASGGSSLINNANAVTSGDSDPSNNLASVTTAVSYPVPTITSISPPERGRGTASFYVTLTGTNFSFDAIAQLGGASRNTEVDSRTQARMWVLATDIQNLGSKSVTITNPTPGGGVSNQKALNIVECSIAAPSPVNVVAAGGTFGVSASTSDGCVWTVSSNAIWVTDLNGGMGSGTLNYTVQPNAGAERTALISLSIPSNGSVAQFSITQAAGVVSRTLYDYDGDGSADISVFRPDGGNWFIKQPGDGFTQQQWGNVTDRIAPADYDGDGKTDIAIYRPGDGTWWVMNSLTSTFSSQQWGDANDVIVPGDYTGDGKSDHAVWRPSDGNWYIRDISNGQYTATQWGAATDIPVPADYNGDGLADIAVWRPSDGNWYIKQPGGGFTITQWGNSNDKLVPADYNANGRANIAIWRPSSGVWWILNDTGTGLEGIQWGSSTDLPVPADFDGDGETNIAVWRPENGFWYILNDTGGGFTSTQWGSNGDIPTPYAFVK